MACPTCDHTMQGLGDQWSWCPRCGTVRGHAAHSVPTLVMRVQNLLHGADADTRETCRRLGILESISAPEERQ